MRFSLIIFVSLFFVACVKDKPNPNPGAGVDSAALKILVANEGVFGNGNASLSYIDKSKNSIVNDVYQQVNNAEMGDIFQSMTVWKDNLYLIINNSNKILIVDKKTFKLKSQIAVQQPRYMQVVGDKAFVTSLYVSKIYVINLETNVVEHVIATPNRSTEGIAYLNNSIYVCPWDTQCNYIYQINPSNYQISQIPIGGYSPTQMAIDKNNNLWVLTGNKLYHKTASITQINPLTNSIIKTIPLSNDAEIIKPCFNPTKDTLYYIGVNYQGSTAYNGIFRMPITATSAPITPFVAAQNLQYFWALGIDPETGKIYVGNPKGFIQRSTILRYNQQGVVEQQYQSGLGVSGFLFF